MNTMAMRMRQVEAFRAVMLSGGVTAAAAMLHISQPSVSRLIADLERDVGFRLFDRQGGRIQPTAQAHMLFEAVRRSFAGLDLLDHAARRIRAHPIGTVRIAALAAIATAVLPPVLRRFNARFPAVKVTVEALGQRTIEDRIFLGQADLGIGVASGAREGVRVSRMAQARYVCLLPTGHRLEKKKTIAISDLAGEDFIGPMHEADALWNGIDDALSEAGVTVQRKFETQQSHALYALVEAGLGVAIAEPFSARLFARLGLEIRPILPKIAWDFVFLEPDIGPTPDIVVWLRETVAEEAANCLKSVNDIATPRPARRRRRSRRSAG